MEEAALFLLMLLVLPYTTTLVHCTNNNSSISIILLAGQSNMVGEGGQHLIDHTFVWDGVVPPESQPNERILRLNNHLQWEIAREPLHLGIGVQQPCGIGPGMPFANSTLKPGETIGLVPCAVGNTNISVWQRGTPNYNRALTRARAAVSNGGVIRAMLWYQGESDSNFESDAKAYKPKLVRFFNDLRSDLHSPSLPIIQVGLATGGMFKEAVREVQLNTGLPNVYCVDALKLKPTIQNDTLNVHLDTPSQVKLGKAIATVFLNISATLI